MHRHSPRVLAVAAVLFAVTALPCSSYAALELIPFTGRVVPTNAMASDAATPIVMQVDGMSLYGGRLAWRNGTRFTPELSAGFGRGRLILVGGGEIEDSAQQFQLDARVRVALNRPGGATEFALIAGGGMQRLHSAVFDVLRENGAELSLRSRPAGIIGLGTSVRLGDTWRARIDFEDHVHRTELEATDFPDKNTQHDLMMSLGLVLPLGSK